MDGSLTLDEVNQLVATLLAGIRTGDNGDDRVYLLPEVADRTGFALDTLEADCRAGTYEHTRKGRTRGMTSRQIAEMVRRHATGGETATVRDTGIRSGAGRKPRRAA